MSQFRHCVTTLKFHCFSFHKGNHYAAQHIRTVASRLDRTWKEFAAGLDERTAVLGLSVLFHHKAEQYCDSVSSWAAACEATQPLPADIQSLETAIRTHQSLYEAMCQAYTEVRSLPVSYVVNTPPNHPTHLRYHHSPL